MATDTVPTARARSPHGPPAEPSGTRGLQILAWVLRQQRRALLGWALALVAVSAIYVSFYPAMGGGDELQALVDGLPEGLVAALGYDALGTAAGYLESTVFALLGPILMLVFAVGFGARVVAGLEEEGALELESCLPVSRRRVVLERALALAACVIALAATVGATSGVLVAALDLEVALRGIAAATLGLALLVLAHGLVTFAVGAATGRRAIAVALGAGLAVVGYITNALSPLLEDGDWLAAASTFHWYLGSEPLVEGVGVGFVGLALLALIAVLIAVVGYERRDLMV